MKRFSKMVSVMCEVPSARVISAINCACRSVGKPGNGAVVTSTGASPAPLRATRMPSLVGVDRGAGLRQHVERGLQQFGPRVLQQHVAAGHGHGHGVGAGLDAVGQHGMARAVQAVDALDHDARGAGAGDLGAHLVEAVGDVADLRLARGVLDHRGAAGERGRHQRGVGAADGDLGKVDLAAAQTLFARAR